MNAQENQDDIFASRLRTAREERGLGQQKLAEVTGLPPSSISHFEAGSRKPSFDNLRRLSKALDVTTDYLLGRVPELNRVEGAERIHRHLNKLSEDDLQLADDFIAMLAKRDATKDRGS